MRRLDIFHAPVGMQLLHQIGGSKKTLRRVKSKQLITDRSAEKTEFLIVSNSLHEREIVFLVCETQRFYRARIQHLYPYSLFT